MAYNECVLLRIFSFFRRKMRVNLKKKILLQDAYESTTTTTTNLFRKMRNNLLVTLQKDVVPVSLHYCLSVFVILLLSAAATTTLSSTGYTRYGSSDGKESFNTK